jgi:hypothetical protein
MHKSLRTYFVEPFALCGSQHIAKDDLNEAVRRNSHRKADWPTALQAGVFS